MTVKTGVSIDKDYTVHTKGRRSTKRRQTVRGLSRTIQKHDTVIAWLMRGGAYLTDYQIIFNNWQIQNKCQNRSQFVDRFKKSEKF